MAKTPKFKKELNKMNLVLSILIALALWVFVVYNTNPTTTETYRELPITITNEENLMNNGLAVSAVSQSTLRVVVEGRRVDLQNLSESDVRATVDVADAGKGRNLLAVHITTPNNITVKTQSVNSIEVTVEDLVTKTVETKPLFDDETKSEPVVTEQSVDEVEVRGAASLVERVAYAKLPLHSDEVIQEEKTFEVKPVPIDRQGNEISFVDVNPSTVTVKAIDGEMKTVDLTVHVSNAETDDFIRTYDAPTTMKVKGLPDDLADLDSVETETVDLSNVNSTQEVDLTPILPKGIYAADESRFLKMTVTVEYFETKTFDIPASQIKVVGKAQGLKATIDGSVTVTAKGLRKDLDALTESAIHVTVNAADLDAGTHEVKAEIANRDDIRYTVSPSTVRLVLE